MVDREELELMRYFEGARLASEQIDEMKLEASVRKGLNRGKQTWRKRQLSKRWGFAGALALCLAMFFGIWQYGFSNNLSGVMSSQGEIPDYVRSLMTSDMEKAADHGLYQPINKAVEKDGYKVMVDGVLADNQSAIVFYTTENTLGDLPIDSVEYAPIADANVSSIKRGTVIYESADHKPASTGPIMHSFVKFKVNGPKTARGDIHFSGSWGKRFDKKENLKSIYFPVMVDRSKFAGLERTVPINESALFGDHKVTIKNMVLRPLSTTVSIESMDPFSDRFATEILDARLFLGENRKDEFQFCLMPDRSETTYKSSLGKVTNLELAFGSIFYDNYNEATLKATGITETTRTKSKLVIDTTKSQVLSGPPEVKQLDIHSGEKSIFLKVHLNIKEVHSFYSLDRNFTDGAGENYTWEKAQEYIKELIFSIAPSDYVQPLTFTLEKTSDQNIYKTFEAKVHLK